jgi:hypothetical protein
LQTKQQFYVISDKDGKEREGVKEGKGKRRRGVVGKDGIKMKGSLL